MASSTLAFLLVLCVAPGAVQEPRPLPADARREDIVEIDGAKNPELIPQWAAWEFAFRVMGGGPHELPTPVYRVVSREERALILAEAKASLQRDKACQDRVGTLVPLIGKEKDAV